MRRFTFWFVMQFVSYALIVANGRAYNQGSYVFTALTDMLISAQVFIVGKKFAHSDPNTLDRVALAGYICGSVIGSVCSIFITEKIYGR